MQEEMKCPTCGGNKFSLENEDTYKCSYCGCIIKYQNEKEQPKEIIKEVITRIEQAPVQKDIRKMTMSEIMEIWPKWTKIQKIECISLRLSPIVFVLLMLLLLQCE